MDIPITKASPYQDKSIIHQAVLQDLTSYVLQPHISAVGKKLSENFIGNYCGDSLEYAVSIFGYQFYLINYPE